jgi:hypothetical protein
MLHECMASLFFLVSKEYHQERKIDFIRKPPRETAAGAHLSGSAELSSRGGVGERTVPIILTSPFG